MSSAALSRFAVVLPLLLTLFGVCNPADAMPAFAREYGVSCNVCHAAYPRLNEFGATFAGDMNYRLPNWRDKTIKTGDDQLALQPSLPLAARVQAYVQGRDGESIDPISGGVEADASVDFQAPYLVKLLSSAPLTDNISYYFYMIFTEKGANTEVIVEDAWFSYADLFNSGVDAMLGQFQVSDLMFPREIRMTFQDFMAYRFAGVTYDRGVLFGRGFGPCWIHCHDPLKGRDRIFEIGIAGSTIDRQWAEHHPNRSRRPGPDTTAHGIFDSRPEPLFLLFLAHVEKVLDELDA